MTKAPQRFPLSWPAHKPRTPPRERQRGQFSSGAKRITMPGACSKLELEVQRLGGVYPLLSSNYETKMDGSPRLDRGSPTDPGVCLYFQMHGKPYAMACDTYTEAAQNIAAIANHIEATRRIARYGVATAAEALQAFTALPPPASGPVKRPWHEVLGVPADIGSLMHSTIAKGAISASFKEKARDIHPDRGGTTDQMAELNRARDEALAAIGEA